jgi:RNA-directed DNA polymerase
MKRDNYLFEKIADPDNLRLAFWKAKKGKSFKQEVLLYQTNLDKNLAQLRSDLLNNKSAVGNYRYFKIFDPKERQICAAAFSERVLHHALMNICHQNFEKFQIYDSYASRLNKGTFAALERAKVFQKKYQWFLKLDVRKYFDSIDHLILKKMLGNRFKEIKLINIFSEIIDSYHTNPEKGLPIGNLTSQYFANHYLATVDHFIKEELQVKAYVRYMDDMVLWSDDKNEINNFGKRINDYMNTHLKLLLKPFCLNKSSKGLPFLGFLIFPTMIKLNRNSKNRFYNKLKTYEKNLTEGFWNQNDYQRYILPLISFIKYADSAGFRTKCMQTIHIGQ